MNPELLVRKLHRLVAGGYQSYAAELHQGEEGPAVAACRLASQHGAVGLVETYILTCLYTAHHQVVAAAADVHPRGLVAVAEDAIHRHHL